MKDAVKEIQTFDTFYYEDFQILLQGIFFFLRMSMNIYIYIYIQSYIYVFICETPGVTGKFGLGIWNEAGQRLIEFCQENTMIITNTLFQQHKRRLYTWTSPDGQHRNQIDYILCSQRWRSSNSQPKLDQEPTVAQIMNSLLPNSDLN